jgi:prepilin-type N-terminal cleavage/methylation domain-containing protein
MARRKVIRDTEERGFSLVELVVVIVIVMIVAAFGLPKLMTAVHTARLRGTGTGVSGMAQAARWRAVQDDRFYSVRFIVSAGGAVEGYVDMFPQNINGASGNGPGGPLDPNDPQILVSGEVAQQPQGNAPNTANLQGQLLPAGSPVVPLDGNNAGSPVTFGPRGLPCLPTATNGGTVCDSAGGPQAYWLFFQNTITQDWEAVTVTPAGRIQTWIFTGGWVANQM